MKNIFILIVTAAMLFLGGCLPGRKSKMLVKNKADQLTDSLNLAWKQLTSSDDNKIATIKRLLEEVSYIESHNEAEQKRLLALQQQLTAKRYTQETMTSEKIDAYDLATDSLISQSIRLARITPGIESHPIAEKLIEEIQTEDGRLVVYRAYFDRWVKEYNRYIAENQKKLAKLGPPYSEYKPKMLFELPPNK